MLPFPKINRTIFFSGGRGIILDRRLTWNKRTVIVRGKVAGMAFLNLYIASLSSNAFAIKNKLLVYNAYACRIWGFAINNNLKYLYRTPAPRKKTKKNLRIIRNGNRN